MDVLGLIVTIVASFASGVLATVISQRMSRTEEHRRQLREVYGSFLTALAELIEEEGRLAMFDHVTRQKQAHETLANVPASPAGLSRAEIVRKVSDARGCVQKTQIRILMYERSVEFVNRVRELSSMTYNPDGCCTEIERVAHLLEFRQAAESAVSSLQNDLRLRHPILTSVH